MGVEVVSEIESDCRAKVLAEKYFSLMVRFFTAYSPAGIYGAPTLVVVLPLTERFMHVCLCRDHLLYEERLSHFEVLSVFLFCSSFAETINRIKAYKQFDLGIAFCGEYGCEISSG